MGKKSSERQFSLGAISRGILAGGNYLWSNYPGPIIRGQSSRGQLSARQYSSGAIIIIIIPGRLSGGGQLSSGAIIRGRAIIQGAIAREAIILGAIFLGGNCPYTTKEHDKANLHLYYMPARMTKQLSRCSLTPIKKSRVSYIK